MMSRFMIRLSGRRLQQAAEGIAAARRGLPAMGEILTNLAARGLYDEYYRLMAIQSYLQGHINNAERALNAEYDKLVRLTQYDAPIIGLETEREPRSL